MHVLLTGIVGSTAYGLAGPNSDIDRLGVFAAPTLDLTGLHPPEDTVASTKPDSTMHESRKFCRLALACNPTVSELLWLPDALYEMRTTLGNDLIDIRAAFLSQKRVRDAYLGYATQQFRRLEARGDGSFSADTRHRTAKHARHLLRLCHQGLELYLTGQLTVRLAEPKRFREFGDRVADGDLDHARQTIGDFETQFNHSVPSLPTAPDEPRVEKWLRDVRWGCLVA